MSLEIFHPLPLVVLCCLWSFRASGWKMYVLVAFFSAFCNHLASPSSHFASLCGHLYYNNCILCLSVVILSLFCSVSSLSGCFFVSFFIIILIKKKNFLHVVLVLNLWPDLASLVVIQHPLVVICVSLWFCILCGNFASLSGSSVFFFLCICFKV